MRLTATISIALLATACVTPPDNDTTDESSSSSSSTDGATTIQEPTDDATTGGAEGSTGSTTGLDDTVGESTGSGGVGEHCELHMVPTGCAPGLKCIPYSNNGGSGWNDVGCFPIDPEAVDLYEPCEWVDAPFSGYDNCGDNAYCLDYTGEGGFCQGLCITADEASGDATCEDPDAVGGYGCQDCFCSCDRSCNPLEQDSCLEGEGCYAVGGNVDFTCAPDVSGETGTYGDPCEFVNVCDPGYYCSNIDAVPSCDEGVGCCTPFCDVTQPNTCPGAGEGQECVSWWAKGPAAPKGFEDVGACAVPT